MSVLKVDSPPRGGGVRGGGSFKVLPSILYVLWCITFIIVRIYSVSADGNIRDTACGRHTHLWYFAFLSTTFCGVNLVTFFIWPGGGEAARARAMVLVILHGCFAVWGFLMWRGITRECSTLITEHYKTLSTFHDISVVHNAGLFVLMFLHETGVGKRVGGDFTLMPEIHLPEEAKRPEENERLKAVDVDECGFSGAKPQRVSPVTGSGHAGLYHAPVVQSLAGLDRDLNMDRRLSPPRLRPSDGYSDQFHSPSPERPEPSRILSTTVL